MKVSLKIDGVLDADCTPKFNGKTLIVHTSKENPNSDHELEVILEDDEFGFGVDIPAGILVCFDKDRRLSNVWNTISFKSWEALKMQLIDNEGEVAMHWNCFGSVKLPVTNEDGRYVESEIIYAIIPKQVIEEYNIRGVRIIGSDLNHDYIKILLADNEESEHPVMLIRRDPSKEDEYWYPIK